MKTLLHCALGVSFAALATAPVRRADAMPSYITNTGSWNQDTDSTPTPLTSSTTHYCYLTRVTGHFVGGGEWVRTWADSTNSWFVGGGSNQQSVSASANCMPYTTFTPEPGGVNNWHGWWYYNTGPNPSVCFLCLGPPPKNLTPTFAWQGDAALMIAGITGQFNGGGEHVDVQQAGSAFAYNTFSASSQSPNGAGGWAQSLFVGIPQSGFNPAFYGPSAGPASANEAGEYSASTSAGNPPAMTFMAPTSKAFCFFTHIGGAFAGAGEVVSISTAMLEGVEHWVLKVASGQGNGTYARARCYALDQSESMAE